MKVVYVSRACNEKIYMRLKEKPSQAAVKFNRLLAEGLSLNDKKIYCIGTENSMQCEKLRIESDEKFKNLSYMILGKMSFFKKNITIIKTMYNLIEQEDIVICDYLNIKNSFWALVISKIKRSKNVCIITDFPEYLENIKDRGIKSKIYIKIAYLLINSFDKYIFLTKYMNEKIKKNLKEDEYVIIEGIADYVKRKEERLANVRKTCLYTGSLHKEYGIDKLVEAFGRIDIPEAELLIYGDGNYKEEIVEKCKKYKNIKYKGVVSNEEILNIQSTATLLINPRNDEGEYTKYSFPSKNMEYLSTGKPVIGFKLPGIEDEYYKFMYCFKGKEIEDIKDTLVEVLNKETDELEKRGELGRKFVECYKNKKVQTKKILKMMKGI